MFKQSTTLKASIVFAICSIISACGGGGSSSSSSENDTTPDANIALQQQVLTSMANAVLPVLQSAQTNFQNLETKVEEYCDEVELSSANIDTSLASAKTAWQDAMTQWQKAEVMNFGPAKDGGNNSIRERIYSWPAVSSCFVDGAVVAYDDDAGAFSISNQTPRRIGLDALEYLLFNDNLNHSCSTDSSTTSGTFGAWDSRSDNDRSLARCKYAAVVAEDISNQSSTLLTQWQGAGDNYAQQLSTAGTTSTRYSSARDALNEISDAMFYIEKELKDLKVAEPAGISASCATASCPELIESQYAEHSLENIKANLEGFLALLNNGMDTLLNNVDLSSVATEMTTHANAAISSIDNYSGTFKDSLVGLDEADCTNSTSENRLEPACALHADIKKVTDLLKSDFVIALNFAIPQTAEGDND